MRFLFVDKITEQSESTVVGARLFAVEEPLRYISPGGSQRIAPGIVSEAIGQLASWKCIKDNDFSARPVFLFADKIKVFSDIAPGTYLDLKAEVHEVNSETLRFSGCALRNGEVVQEISECIGYFMPLAELEDPEVTRSRYLALTSGGLTLQGTSESPFNFFNLIDDSPELIAGKTITAKINLTEREPFYADHFPRMPVTPIVVLNELIGATTCVLYSGRKLRCLTPRLIEGIKIKSFVRPGDQIEIKVTMNGEARQGAVETVAEIFKEGKRILRGSYHYLVEENL
jgi:3-hydroxymyristoyl/3-hydroxydecanoyl-(acyl carrier protein) dehydratase